MSSKFYIVDNKTWHPSTFYNERTTLQWIMEYKLFKKVYLDKKRENGINYAIHRDVYNAFLYKFKNSNMKKTRKKMRKKTIMRKLKTRDV